MWERQESALTLPTGYIRWTLATADDWSANHRLMNVCCTS